jgi:hypothetical protein
MNLKEIQFESELNLTDSCFENVLINCERENEQNAYIKEREFLD